MLLFRSLTLGLVAACFALLLARPTVELRVARERPFEIMVEHAQARVEQRPTIIDVASGVTSSQLASMIRIAPGEHITMVDDVTVAGEIDAGVVLAAIPLHARRFIDVAIATPAGERRVLVLLH